MKNSLYKGESKMKKIYILFVLIFIISNQICFAGNSISIHKASERGDLNEVKNILKQKPELLNSQDGYGLTPLHYASGEGHIEIVKYLLKLRADTNIKDNLFGWTPYTYASGNKHEDIVLLLKQYVNNDNIKQVDKDLEFTDNIKKFAEALSQNKTAKTQQAQQNIYDAFGYIKSKESKLEKDAFLQALESNDIQKVKNYLDKENYINKKYVYSYQWLMGKNENVTPLMIAANRGNDDIVELLIKKGAEVNAKDDSGYTALMIAAHQGKCNSLRILLKNGAYVNQKKPSGDTALILASMLGHVECVKILIDNKADKNIRNLMGDTALDQAIVWNHTKVISILQSSN